MIARPCIRVLKFGGTSVATPERWRQVRGIVEERLATGVRPVVVVSALSGVTNLLEDVLRALRLREPTRDLLADVRHRHERLADGLDVRDHSGYRAVLASLESHVDAVAGAELADRDRAAILAHGELASSALGAAWLRESGLSVDLQDVRQWVRASGDGAEGSHHPYLSAAARSERDPALQRRLLSRPATVTITQGFLACNDRGETVLLGRGGSDTSASLLGAILGATEVEIWTDVPGVFTADPRILPQARLLDRVSYDEAEVFATNGAKVLHSRCIAPLRAGGTPLSVRWIDRPDTCGTRVDGTEPRPGVKGVGLREGLCLLTLDRLGGGGSTHDFATVLAAFDRVGFALDLLATGRDRVQLTLDPRSSPGLEARLPDLVERLGLACRASLQRGVAAVSLVGHDLCGSLRELAAYLACLRDWSFPIVQHAADGHSFTVVATNGAARELHAGLHETLLLHGKDDIRTAPAWEQLDRTNTTTSSPPTPVLRAGAALGASS